MIDFVPQKKPFKSTDEAVIYDKPHWYRAAFRVLRMFRAGYNPTEHQILDLEGALEEYDFKELLDV